MTSIIELKSGDSIIHNIHRAPTGKAKTAFGYMQEYEKKYRDEKWKNVPSEIINRINKYKIFNYGRIENHQRTITNGSINSHGYSRVSVIPKEYSLHRLVAKVFILNLENKYRINLVHENKANACINNLE